MAAHSNLMTDGHGMGVKAHDLFVAYLCSTCHHKYDTCQISQGEFDQAVKRTIEIGYRDGTLS